MEYLPRIIEQKLDKWIFRKEVILLKGARQTGKTTLLKHLKEKYGGEYLSLEIEENAHALKKDPLSFAKKFLSKKILYLDEVQYVKDVGRYIKIVYDYFGEKLKLVLTGSGSFEVKENIGKYLVGRAVYFELFPLSFSEFLLWKNPELFNLYEEYQKSLWNFIYERTSVLKSCIFEKEFFKLFDEFLLFGGYPAIVKEEDFEIKKILLQNLVQTYLVKDVFFFLNVRQLEKFKTLLKTLAFNIGGILELSSLAKELKLDYRTAENYLSILVNTYVIELISPFYKSMVTELKKSKKLYFLDTGLRNAILGNFQEFEFRTDKGALLENFVCAELKKKGILPKFWRTSGKAEIDFIIDLDKKIIPVEVKMSPRLGRSFYSFLNTYRPERALILSYSPEVKIEKKKKTLLGIAPCFFI